MSLMKRIGKAVARANARAIRPDDVVKHHAGGGINVKNDTLSYREGRMGRNQFWPTGVKSQVSREAYAATERAQGFNHMTPEERLKFAKSYDKALGPGRPGPGQKWQNESKPGAGYLSGEKESAAWHAKNRAADIKHFARKSAGGGGGGEVQVSGYTRNGHEVSGYTRSRPSK